MIHSSRRTFLQGALATTSSAWLAASSPSLLAADNGPLPDAAFREKLLEGWGGPWPETQDVHVRLRETIKKEGYTIESLYYQSEPDDQVPALLLIPDGVSPDRPAPAVVCLHQHQYRFGKNEPAGLDGAPMHHTGAALAREGYVVLCPDMLCFGERRDEVLHNGDYERFEFLRYVVDGKCLTWKNILDIRRGVDLLVGRREVQSDRIGCYGHSMGSTNTYMVGPWEP